MYFQGKTVFEQKLRTSAGMRWDSMLTYLDQKISMEVTAKQKEIKLGKEELQISKGKKIKK